MLRKPTINQEYMELLSQGELDCITAKAMKNDVEASVAISRLYEGGYCAPCAMRDKYDWAEKAAEAGDVEMMVHVGFRYAQGDLQGTKMDKGVQLLEKAAQLGHVVAMIELGYWYDEQYFLDGTYPAKAVYWTEKAAALGSLPAMRQLSEMYALGRHVKQNTKQSRYWARKLKEQDSYYKALDKAQKLTQGSH